MPQLSFLNTLTTTNTNTTTTAKATFRAAAIDGRRERLTKRVRFFDQTNVDVVQKALNVSAF
jgi:hypothetical protein